jgi:hypothetical protein
LLWRGGEGLRKRTKQILLVSLALCVGYVIASAPVAMVNATKEKTAGLGAHVFILGLAEPFQDSLGFERANYALLRDYSDEQVQALVNLHHSGVGAALISHIDQDYDAPSYALYFEMLAATPHDALMRVFATANALGAYPLNNLVYGPLSVLLITVGFFLLPRRTLFYCICGAIVVPVLSLQLHQRHAFYAVVFGAAALGFAYTLAAMATIAVANRSQFTRPSRTKVVTRAALLAGSTVSIVVLVYVADQFAIGHQQRALTALHQIYRNADWSPIEMVQGNSRLRFPTLMPTPERMVGVMARRKKVNW